VLLHQSGYGRRQLLEPPEAAFGTALASSVAIATCTSCESSDTVLRGALMGQAGITSDIQPLAPLPRSDALLSRWLLLSLRFEASHQSILLSHAGAACLKARLGLTQARCARRKKPHSKLLRIFPAPLGCRVIPDGILQKQKTRKPFGSPGLQSILLITWGLFFPALPGYFLPSVAKTRIH
jgi:hypothetical protein